MGSEKWNKYCSQLYTKACGQTEQQENKTPKHPRRETLQAPTGAGKKATKKSANDRRECNRCAQKSHLRPGESECRVVEGCSWTLAGNGGVRWVAGSRVLVICEQRRRQVVRCVDSVCAADEAADGQGGATTTYTPNYGKAIRAQKEDGTARRNKKKHTVIKDEHVS